MSSSDRTLHLSPGLALPPSGDADGGEPSTRRMTPDEVRALLSRIEHEPTPSRDAPDTPRPLVRGVVDLADASELPTLLYRPRKQLTRAMLRLDATDAAPDAPSHTLHGLGPSRGPRIVFASRSDDASAVEDDLWDDWVHTSELSAFAADDGNKDEAPAYQASVSPPAPSLSPPAGETSPPAAATVEGSPRSQSERLRSALARRSRRIAWLVFALIAASPVIVALVRWTSTPAHERAVEPDDDTSVSAGDEVRGADGTARADDVTMMGEGETSADVGLPRALQASARALEAAGRTDAAARARRAALAGATEQLLAGENVEALAAFRALSQGEPPVPMLGAVVRQLEQQLRACAARGGSACR